MTDIDIANLALAKIGDAQITAFADKSDLGLQNIYNQTRDDLIALFPWDFSKKRVTLTLTAETVLAFDFNYSVALPVDYLSQPMIYKTGVPFVVENTKLYCDKITVYFGYAAQITDPTKFTALFIESFTLLLASKLAIPISNDKTLSNDLLIIFFKRMSEIFDIKQSELPLRRTSFKNKETE